MPSLSLSLVSDDCDDDKYEKGVSCLMNYGMQFSPQIITHAQGSYLYTSQNKKLLDWSSGQMACILGHSHPSIVKAIAGASANLMHLLSANLSPPVIELAERLTGVLPAGLDRAMFLSTGSEGCEAAIKLAKIFTGKYEIVGLGSSWHGMTGGSLSAQYHSGRQGHGPMIPGNLSLPAPNSYRSIFRRNDGSWNWEAELDYGWDAIDQNSCGSLAAVIVEPILSSGGILTLPPGYLKAMRAHCTKRGMLLILDEAQTAMGRCGTMFAFEQHGIVPDVLVLSKTLGAGYPLSAVITSNEIATVCAERDFFFCTTHVNDPLGATVGLAVVNTIIADNLVGQARDVGAVLLSGLESLQRRYGCIGDVRGTGMLAAIEIVSDRESKEPAPKVAKALSAKMIQLGLSVNLTTFGRVFRIAPPLTTTDEEMRFGLEIMETAFQVTENTIPLHTPSSTK